MEKCNNWRKNISVATAATKQRSDRCINIPLTCQVFFSNATKPPRAPAITFALSETNPIVLRSGILVSSN